MDHEKPFMVVYDLFIAEKKKPKDSFLRVI